MGPVIAEERVPMSLAGMSQSPNVRIRQNFPETWLWDSVNSGLVKSWFIRICSILGRLFFRVPGWLE